MRRLAHDALPLRQAVARLVVFAAAANGQLPFQSGKATFADMFWHAWRSADLDLPKDTSKCYMFELMLPQNIIVVRHARPTLTLLGARDSTSLTELDCEEVGAANGWPTPRRFLSSEASMR